MIRNLLTSVIVWIHQTLKSINAKPDYKIIDVSMEYYLDITKTPYELDDFWESEHEEWDGETEEFYKDLNTINYKNTDIPNNVTKTTVRIKYWYNDIMYKYLTYDMNHQWPPERKSGVVFNIPIVSAQLVDSDDKPVKDLLNKIRRYAGPRCDFYNQHVKISDMLYYDIETLGNEYPKIKIKNALGMIKTVSTVDGYLTDLRVP